MTQNSDGASGAQRRAVDHLMGLYSPVIAVALGLIALNTVSHEEGDLEIAWDHLWLGGALIVLLVPFYQGAMLHLDKKYKQKDPHRSIVVLVDFIGLFLEAIIIVALAASVGDAHSFTVALSILLAIDVAWAALAARLDKAEDVQLGAWLKINAGSCFVLAALFIASIWIDYPDGWLPALVLGGVSVRTSLDYALNWDFYGGRSSPYGS